MSFKTRANTVLERAGRLGRTPRLITISGNPELDRLKAMGQLAPLAMGSDREATVGGELFAAPDNETTVAFHRRMLGVAREKGEAWVFLGCPSNVEPPKGARPYPVQRPVAET